LNEKDIECEKLFMLSLFDCSFY